MITLQISNYEADIIILNNQNISEYINHSMIDYKNLTRFICLADIESLPCGFFKGHIKINTVYIPLLQNISNQLFMGSTISKIICGNNMTSFGDYSFYLCNNLIHIQLPNNLISIGRNCFANSNLTNIIFNNNLKYIGKYAFEKCKMKTLYLPKNIQFLGNGAFHRCYNLESIIIDSDIETLPSFVFSRCINLKYIIIRNKTLKCIETDAFEDCPNLQQISVYSKNVNIQDGAFSNNVNYVIHS